MKTPNANFQKLDSIAQILNYPSILLDARAIGKITSQQVATDMPIENFFSFNHLQNETLSDFQYTPSPEDLALIQFSSGSTGEPKGVCLTHHNISTNLEAIARGMDLNQDDIIDSWLPLHHDMGLIGFHLVPLFNLRCY